MDFEFESFFGQKGVNARTREYFISLKKSTNKILEYILEDADESEIDAAEKDILKFSEPKVYGGPRGEEVSFISSYETNFVWLAQHVAKDPRTMSILEYYKTLEIVEKKIRNGQSG